MFALEEFFAGEVRNAHTGRAYERAVHSFLAWCQERGLLLTTITSGDVGRYLDSLDLVAPSKKVHLAALRKFFDRLTVRHAVVLNPAASVRAERYTVVEGKTAEIGIKDARKLLASIDVGNVVGLRGRALLGVTHLFVREPSLRLYVRARELKAAGMDWTEVLALNAENPRARLAAEILGSSSFQRTSHRVEAFVRRGGGCRATYFN